MVFDRNAPIERKQAPTRLIGIGHSLFDRALKEGLSHEAFFIRCAHLERPLLVATISDEVTGQGQTVHQIVIGISRDENGDVSILRDWELLLRLNRLGRADDSVPQPELDLTELRQLTRDFVFFAQAEASTIADGMIRPVVRADVLLIPDNRAQEDI